MRHTTETIPGTTYPFPALAGGKRPELRSAAEERQRRGLLAKVHIAKQQMGLNEGEYEMILRGFKVASAAHLTIAQLENMVKLLKHYGWKPARTLRKKAPAENRLQALRARCVAEAALIPDGERRLAGLAQKICGTAQLAWCHDAGKIERLLAVLGKIKGG
jgi:phage gp16-like protein